MSPDATRPWLALVVGNTRLHWAWFTDETLQSVWHTPPLTAATVTHLRQAQFAPEAWGNVNGLEGNPPKGNCWRDTRPIPLVLASVVPQQTALWQSYDSLHEVRLDALPLANLYPTLGIDRALNLLGAGDRDGWPILVVDAGTALTLTAGVAGRFAGGAILPGLAMQFQALGRQTASLPQTDRGSTLPPRWAQSTPEAIRSGILYGAVATIRDFWADWQRHHPTAQIILTGGDGALLEQGLATGDRPLPCRYDPDLTFWGLVCYRRHLALLSEDMNLGGIDD